MKRKLYYLILIISFHFTYSQKTSALKDTILLKDVLIKKVPIKNEMKFIIKKIKNNLRKNYYQGNLNYEINHFALKDDSDTLVNRKTQNNLNIKILSESEIQNILLRDPANTFKIDTSSYARFEPSENNNVYWLSLSIFYDSLHVLDFDFFDLNRDYIYTISHDEEITTVTFKSSKYYSGYFAFNNVSYNLTRIAFKNTIPYEYNYSGTNSNLLLFESKWNYNIVTILLDFKNADDGKLMLKNLSALQEITQYSFKRYNERKTQIDHGINIKFYSTLIIRLLQH